jgi:hypothetical protein
MSISTHTAMHTYKQHSTGSNTFTHSRLSKQSDSTFGEQGLIFQEALKIHVHFRNKLNRMDKSLMKRNKKTVVTEVLYCSRHAKCFLTSSHDANVSFGIVIPWDQRKKYPKTQAVS